MLKSTWLVMLAMCSALALAGCSDDANGSTADGGANTQDAGAGDNGNAGTNGGSAGTRSDDDEDASTDEGSAGTNGGSAGSDFGNAGTNGGGAGTGNGSAGTGAGGKAVDGWFCTMAADACSCVLSPDYSAFDCVLPEDGCCFEVVSGGKVNGCQCWPKGSATCTLVDTMEEGYKSVDTCPNVD